MTHKASFFLTLSWLLTAIAIGYTVKLKEERDSAQWMSDQALSALDEGASDIRRCNAILRRERYKESL